jgi:hypothetical protein
MKISTLKSSNVKPNVISHCDPLLGDEILRVQDTGEIALLNTLKSQRGNQGSADTASVLGSQDLDRILLVRILLLGPIQDLAQGRGTTSLEVGILVEDGSVGADMAGVVTRLLADSGNATC